MTTSNENMGIKERLKAGHRAYYSLQKLLKSRLLSRETKKKVYRTVLRPVVMYSCESWVMTSRDETLLNTWERKILRRIYGPVAEAGLWRSRTNEEVYSLYGEPSLVTEIKRARIRWLGHVERMPSERAARKSANEKPEGRRLRGRPRKRWLEDVEEDLRELGVRRWRQKAADRDEWKRIVEEAKTLNGP